MSEPNLTNNYKTWDVKLIWIVGFPSRIFASGGITAGTIELLGADRGSISITRPLTRISSLEQYNQGFIDGVPDIRVTVFTKESGGNFENMRRLSASKIPFDISLNLEDAYEDNTHEGIWIDGYEEFLGCRVTSERTNYAIADMPVREFECMALRHYIKATADFNLMIEGDGSYATSWPSVAGTTPPDDTTIPE